MIHVDATKEYPLSVVAPGARHAGTKWCHLWSAENDEAELLAFAKRIKLRPQWIQNRYCVIIKAPFYHFDITPSRRRSAMLNGAVEKRLMLWLQENMKPRVSEA